MYTRSFNEKEEMLIPESYGGSMLTRHTHIADEPTQNDECPHNDSEEVGANPRGFLRGARIGTLFDGFPELMSRLGLRVPKIGIEELIIIAVAAFLLLSPEGDRECSLMLLLLLFVG